MDSNIKPDFQRIQLVVNDIIVGLAQSYKLFEPCRQEIWGEFSRIIFYKKHCNPFPRFFNLEMIENDKLTNTIRDLYLGDVVHCSPEELEKLQFRCPITITNDNCIILENNIRFSNENSTMLKEYYSIIDLEFQEKKKQIFTDKFKKELELGKYTSWVNQLSPEQLQGLFWMIGEVKIRSGRVFNESKINEICRSLDEDKMGGSTERMTAGLRLFLEFLSGKERTLDEVRKEIVESVK